MSSHISRLQRVLTVGCLLLLVSSGVAGSVVTSTSVDAKTDTGQESPIEVWNETYGTAGTDVVTALAPTADGGYLVAGVAGFDSSNPEAWLLKITRRGTVQWERTYGGPDLDVITDVAVGEDGYVLVGAQDVTLRTGSAWVARVQTDGRLEWSRTFTPDNFTIANAITRTDTGQYVVGGATGSLLESDTDAWAVNLRSNGDIQWNRTYDADAITGLVGGPEDGVTASGFAGNRRDGWLARLAGGGEPRWTRQYGSETGRFTTIHRTERGYVLGGTSSSDGNDGDDAWILRTSEDGSRQWSKKYGGDGADAAASVTTVEGSPVFTGIRGSRNWVGGLSADNGIVWSRTYDTSGFTLDNRIVQPSAITTTTDGGVLVAVVSEEGNVQLRKLVPGSAVFDQKLPGIEAEGEPRDPDGDGLYEDVDGDGEFSYSDAIELAFVDEEDITEAQIAGLDFDGDGDLDFDDALELAFQT